MTIRPSRLKKNWLNTKCVLILGLFLGTGFVGAQELSSNPGFETGTTAGWFAFGSPTIFAQSSQVHSGSFAGMVTNRTASYMGIAQSFQGVLTPGQTCTVSVWVRLAGGANQTMQVTAQKTDGNGTAYSAIASGTVSAGAWTQLAGQYTLTVSGTLTGLTIYLEVPTSTNAAYFADDFLVQAVSTAGTDGQCTVDWNNVYQRIDGFGASSAWRSTWTTAHGDMFFSTNSGTGTSDDGKTNFAYSGIGLSLLRTRIAPGATTVENSLMQMAQARGARVWSAPWSPAAIFKSNGNVNGGGFTGNAANYQAYANQLAGYVARMKSTYNVSLYALSLQNEPDAKVTTYESCNWSAQQFHDFIPYLYNALVASNVAATKIMLPESQNWTDPSNLVAAAMSDSTSNYVSIVANHNYVADNGAGDQTTPAVINSYGRARWETEVAMLSGSDSSINNALYWAGRIHLFLTAAQANAWHYWWLIAAQNGASSPSNEGLADTNGIPAKRMYALGQFSRFVRPDFYRMDASNTSSALISAYKDSLSPRFAIVAINSSSTTVTQVFNLTNFTAATVLTPWITSSNLSLASQSSMAVTNSTCTYVLPAMSIVTFVGQADGAPTNVLLSNNSILETQPPGTVIGNFSTADPDSGNTFTYNLTNGAGGADNAAFTITNNTLYSATHFNHQFQTSQAIRIRSTDQSGLWFEKNFTIAITPDNGRPSIVSITMAGDGNPTMVFSGLANHYYWLQAATNLVPPVYWLTLTNHLNGGTNFVAGLNGLWTNTDLTATNLPVRFYRTLKP
ncbi:MAG TPA: carbohydrate binding domain-containing protein [Verrucomicrobiae bacterium]|nr:carbohydrate binding domain-containing protein [Verrucomicrobiae bacterium]